MKNILVTGADGFIGSHLVELLTKEGFNVNAFCFYNSNNSWGWLDNLEVEIKQNINVCLGDIRDPTCVKLAMKNCDTVFHLAALIAIPYSYVAPSSYIDTNIKGTLNMLESARDLEIEKIVHTSTSETYGSAQYVPIDEMHPLVAQSPYAASKIGADQLALSYWRSFQTPVSILRPFNTYGPRQSARAVIPTIITQLANNKKDIKLGSTTPTRDFNYVDDTCEAFLEVAKSDKTVGRVVNSASKFEISIGEVAYLIAEVMDKEINLVTDSLRIRPEDSEVNRLYGDNHLIKELTNWIPKFSGKAGFKKGIFKTINWFLNDSNIEMYKFNEYNV